MRKIAIIIYVNVFFLGPVFAENGYDLWLRYPKITANSYQKLVNPYFDQVYISNYSQTAEKIKEELNLASKAMLGKKVSFLGKVPKGSGTLLFLATDPYVSKYLPGVSFEGLGQEGYLLKTISNGDGKTSNIVVAANTEVGLLYGVFGLLRKISTQYNLLNLNEKQVPKIGLRMLNHWDNLTMTVERGYAGQSIWKWHTLPDYIDQRYIDYARANASIGINAVSLTNVNANATVLTPMYLQKVKALADVFRPYGIKVFLTARFSAPIEIGNLKTADPLNDSVKQWWADKAREIYTLIPDFGGFLVKANSEGQPGPQNYGRNHADGANLLASALKPFGGVVIWRAFVYSSDTPEDRFKQPYTEFVPLDGKFADNVILQVKNGPIDFQPREPFHPLFGAMPKTATMMEFQLTQEYLGFATHLVYLAPLFKEVLNTDTYRPQQGSTVARVIDGSSFGYKHTGMAGVANIGSDFNWTGHPFAQANWYALGRLAWDYNLSSEQIAREWIAQTFSCNQKATESILQIMMGSHEAAVNYMTPMGLHHIMGYGHHYGPAPWYNKAERADWNCTYFHRADSIGIGFDRTSSGSNALAQYAQPWQEKWGSLKTTGDKWLLWFHHIPWGYKMDSGQTFWDNLCLAYQGGVDSVNNMRQLWKSVSGQIDPYRFQQVEMLLDIQYKEAEWWRDACLSYFKTFSKKDLPAGVEKPAHSLDYYEQLSFPYAPGNSH